MRDDLTALRREVRDFLRATPWDPRTEPFAGFNPAFSQALGARGWIGVSWPVSCGGRGWSADARYLIQEELLAAGAPVLAHTVGERQTGPMLLRYGSEAQQKRYIPDILAGRAPFCIGMSEPNAGSDLAALELRATPVEGGFRVDGSKLWTSLAHLSRYIVVLCRTAQGGARHEGISHLIIDLEAPGVTITPIRNLLGEHEFNQVFFDDVFAPDDALVGQAGAGWSQALSELAFERGGPDRFLSQFPMLTHLIDAIGPAPSDSEAETIGRLVAHLSTLRALARSVARRLGAGEDAAQDAAIVKDLGATFEQDVAEAMRRLFPPDDPRLAPPLRHALDAMIQRAPTFSIRGGAREVLRGVIARNGIVTSASK